MTKHKSHKSDHPRAPRPRRRGGVPMWVSILIVVFLLIVAGFMVILLTR